MLIFEQETRGERFDFQELAFTGPVKLTCEEEEEEAVRNRIALPIRGPQVATLWHCISHCIENRTYNHDLGIGRV